MRWFFGRTFDRTFDRTLDRAVTLAVALVGLAAAPAFAQTPATALGLGIPVPSIDARAAALGGTGLGLPTGSLSARNPADIALFGQPVLGITYAPEGVSVEGDGGSADTGRSRLAVLRGAVPFDDWAIGIAFANELDQDWQVSFSDTLFTGEGTFPFTEQRTHDGGLSSVNFTLGRDFGRVSLGAEYGIVTGRLQQTYRRDFGPDVDDPSVGLGPSAGRANWEYGGSRIRLGAAADLTSRIAVAADVSLQGTLTAERDSIDGATLTREFDMPSAAELGASARLSERILVTAAGGWTGWSGTSAPSDDFAAEDVLWGGVGAELTGTRLLGASVPLRIGLRYTDLPFRPRGADRLKERAVTLGLGVRVAEEQARVDVALEIGSRGDLAGAGIEESFQRLSLTLALFQD